MSRDGQRIKWRRNIAENINHLSRVHERYRRQTDGRAIAYCEHEREFTFAKNTVYSDADSTSEEQSAEFSPSEELANYKAMRVSPACSNTHTAYAVMKATVHQRNLCAVRKRLLVRLTYCHDMPSRLIEDNVEAIELLCWGKCTGLISCLKHWTRTVVYL